ncbi:MAG: zf-HC2 domain-containing protein [Deltaproteobacteria bacterium]|nr:zf-HC2 domain-containing protein [Deltaproteobacteria bacterium]
MLTCKNIRPQLSAYMDCEVPLWKAQIIRWHLKRCPDCAFEFMTLQDTATAMKSLEHVTTSDRFLTEIMTKASLMTSYEQKRLNWTQRLIRRVDAHVAWSRYLFYVLRWKMNAYATVFMLLVTLGFFMSAIPRIITPEPKNTRQTLVKAQTHQSADFILVEFVTPEMLRYYMHER